MGSHDKNYWQRSKFNVSAILPIYGFILIICLLGNTIVCLTIFRNKRMRSRWYFLLFNLSIADMGLALTTPIQLLQFVDVDLGDIGCKCGIYILDIFLGTALLTLACISIDRYHGICNSMKLGERSVRAMVILPLIWLAAAVVYFPYVAVCQKSRKLGSLACDCHSRWQKPKHYTIFAFWITFVIYVIPFGSMLFCYYKIYRRLWGKGEAAYLIQADPTGSKKKSIKMLIATTVLFFIAWTPYNCLYIIKKLNIINPKIFGKLFLIAQVLGFMNSATNPFVYCIFSKTFRDGFKAICCRKKQHEIGDRNGKYRYKKMAQTGTQQKDTGHSSDTGYGSIDTT